MCFIEAELSTRPGEAILLVQNSTPVLDLGKFFVKGQLSSSVHHVKKLDTPKLFSKSWSQILTLTSLDKKVRNFLIINFAKKFRCMKLFESEWEIFPIHFVFRRYEKFSVAVPIIQEKRLYYSYVFWWLINLFSIFCSPSERFLLVLLKVHWCHSQVHSQLNQEAGNPFTIE